MLEPLQASGHWFAVRKRGTDRLGWATGTEMDELFERAQAAVEESRRLHRVRDQIFEDMRQIAAQRLVAARATERWFHDTEQKLVKAASEALRPARGQDG